MMWTGLLATRNVVLGTAVGLALVGWGGSSGAFSDSDSDSDSAQVAELCEAAVERAAGRYSNCLLRAEAKAAEGARDGKLDALRRKCQKRFERKVARVVNESEECVPLTDQIVDRTQEYVEIVSHEAAGRLVLSLLFVQSSEGAILTGGHLEQPENLRGRARTTEQSGTRLRRDHHSRCVWDSISRTVHL